MAVGFWRKVQKLASVGMIVSIDKVRDDLYDRNDQLVLWCRENLPQDFFKDTSEAIQEYARVCNWATSKQNHYLQKAVDEFLSADEADAFLIAYALVDAANRHIVTQEVSSPNSKNKIKIPDCCNDLNITSLNIISMFRELEETF